MRPCIVIVPGFSKPVAHDSDHGRPAGRLQETIDDPHEHIHVLVVVVCPLKHTTKHKHLQPTDPTSILIRLNNNYTIKHSDKEKGVKLQKVYIYKNIKYLLNYYLFIFIF